MNRAGIRLDELGTRLVDSAAGLVFVDEDGDAQEHTFRELHADVSSLVKQLHGCGVADGSRIGILAPNSYRWMVWDLAIISLKGVSVALTQDRLADTLPALIARYSLQLLVVDPAWTGGLATGNAVVPIDALTLPPTTRPSGCVQPPEQPGTHSLVFSSGTTGKTKGLIISTRGTEHLVDLFAQAFGVAAGERFLTFLPFANYQQRMTYYFCLHHGIDFVFCPYGQLFPTLQRYKPTFSIAPPILYESVHAVAAATAPRAAESQRLKDIFGGKMRYLVTGMAPIKRRTLDFYWDHGLPLYEAFGITEAGMVTWNKPDRVKVGTVGTPAEPATVRLDSSGEIIVTRKALLSLGYFEASEEDRAATFIGHDSVATGDIGEFDDDGFLNIIGRKKDAIVTRSGEKFHPETIESLIQRDSRVKVAVVTECPRMLGTTAIIAVSAAVDGAMEGEIHQEIKSLNRNLPACQQVKEVVFTRDDFSIDNGMRTKNLKLNRKAIRSAYLESR